MQGDGSARVDRILRATRHPLSKSKVTMMLAFLDDSKGTSAAALAGYLVLADNWKQIESRWESTITDRDIECMHMEDFGLSGPLWAMPTMKRAMLFRPLIKIIREYVSFGVAGVVPLAEYEQFIPGAPENAAKVYYGPKDKRKTVAISPYGLCFGLCAHAAMLWTEKNFPGDKITFYLDRGSGYGEHARAMFNEMRDGQWDTTYRFGALVFEDDCDVRALQAADMIVCETRKHAERTIRQKGTPSKLLGNLLATVPHWGLTATPHMLQTIASGIHPVDVLQRIEFREPPLAPGRRR